MNIIVADRERKITLLSKDIEALSRDNANKDRRIAELERKVRNNSQDVNKLN